MKAYNTFPSDLKQITRNGVGSKLDKVCSVFIAPKTQRFMSESIKGCGYVEYSAAAMRRNIMSRIKELPGHYRSATVGDTAVKTGGVSLLASETVGILGDMIPGMEYYLSLLPQSKVRVRVSTGRQLFFFPFH